MSIKICGCMPLKYDKEKSQIMLALGDLERTCDEIIILRDFLHKRDPDEILPCSEQITVEWQVGSTWNDWVNRVTLLVRAARLSCDYVMWLDDDERLGPSLTRDRVLGLCEVMEFDTSIGQVVARMRHLWNENEWRCDGQFGMCLKTFLQPNPFVRCPRNIAFEWGPDSALHHFPNLVGTTYEVQDYLIHHGHKTRALREKSVAKYAEHDPENKHSSVRYDWLLDETGIELKPIHEPKVP